MAKSLNKSDLISRVAAGTDLSKRQAGDALDVLLDTIQGEVTKKNKVTIPGFGTFEARKRKARKGRNPQTGAEIKVPATTVPAFKAGQGFKDAVGKKKSGSKSSASKGKKSTKSKSRAKKR